MSRPRVLSLFTGLGGLDLGLEAAGFEIVGSVEIDHQARRSLARNRPSWLSLEPHDVTEFADTVVNDGPAGCSDIDVIAAAPPCQPLNDALSSRKAAKTARRRTATAC